MIEETKTPEQEEKFTLKDKIIAVLLIIIIIMEVLILIIVVKKDRETKYFEVTTSSSNYKISTDESIPIKIKCKDIQKIDIISNVGGLSNKDNTLSALGENKYTVTCENKEIIYWTPDESIKEDETITISFKSDNKKSKEELIKIKKETNEDYTIIK